MKLTRIIFISTLIIIVLMNFGCSSSTIIPTVPGSPGTGQISFGEGISMRIHPKSGEIWLGGASGTALAGSIVKVILPKLAPVKIRANSDGSFLYRFNGDKDSVASVEWIDRTGRNHSESFTIDKTGDEIEKFAAPAGKYPNRMYIHDNLAWVINSGDDEIQSYNLTDLSEGAYRISLPIYSNPWEAVFLDDGRGITTTLFGGVFLFDSKTGVLTAVNTEKFNSFSQPNGVAVLNNEAWIVNPNPISYFPTVLGDGWVDRIELDSNPEIIGQKITGWRNPQNVITDGKFVYVSCAGTVDFPPPDYVATALDNGGVHVIDPESGNIIASFELGLAGAGPMTVTPDGRYLYIASGVSASLCRIDLSRGIVINDVENPIKLDDFALNYVSSMKMLENGLLICASFNSDTIFFVNGWTGERNPFPYFEDYKLAESGEFLGIQDFGVVEKSGKKWLLVLTSVQSGFHWVKL